MIIAAALFASCGKVADPLPPVVQVPEPVTDFAVSQAGYQLRFVWTNPARNVDATTATDLERAVIRADGDIVLDVPVAGPGRLQSAELDARSMVGSSSSFSIEIRGRSERFSASSGRVPITILPVPGPVGDLGALVDQGRISLAWALPLEGRELIDLVRVYRSQELLAELSPMAVGFEDQPYVSGSVYTYAVVAARETADGIIREGVRAPALEVQAVDVTPPGAPQGLVLRVFADDAFLEWDAAPEADVVGYRVFRRDDAEAAFLAISDLLVVTGYNDDGYLPGYGYRVSAVDQSGNESLWSESVE